MARRAVQAAQLSSGILLLLCALPLLVSRFADIDKKSMSRVAGHLTVTITGPRETVAKIASSDSRWTNADTAEVEAGPAQSKLPKPDTAAAKAPTSTP